jgi:hypothetical protein
VPVGAPPGGRYLEAEETVSAASSRPAKTVHCGRSVHESVHEVLSVGVLTGQFLTTIGDVNVGIFGEPGSSSLPAPRWASQPSPPDASSRRASLHSRSAGAGRLTGTAAVDRDFLHTSC